MSTANNAHILIVDDDEMSRMLTRAALEGAGYKVSEASDGNELVSSFEQHQPVLILLDVMMPGVDGFIACEALRAHPLGSHVPVLMMTGLDDVESINRAYEVGATDFVTKPINFDLLDHRLRYMLRAKSTADELRMSEARLASAQQIARLGQWECDGAGRFVHWSDTVSAVLGLRPATVIHDYQAFTELAAANDRARLLRAFTRALERRESFNLEFTLARENDQPVTIHVVFRSPQSIGGDHFVGVVQDVSEQRRAEQQIHQLEFYDDVTGLPNRHAIHEQISRGLAMAKRMQRTFAVLSLDVDHFQRINDSLGLTTGDELLCALGQRLNNALRDSDTVGPARAAAKQGSVVGRIAGDEFIIVLSEITAAEDAAVVAHRIRGAVSQPFDIGGKEIHIGVSIGISVYPDDAANPEDLLKQSATALAHAKREGRDCYQFYTAELNARAFKRLTVEMHLRRALEREQFEVFYQPKIDGQDLSVRGFEALIRWNHPELGRVSPAEFIPIAEETGLIGPIGEWVLNCAAEQLNEWEKLGLGRFDCAVNLSGAQFRAAQLGEQIERVVRAAGLEPARLELELTESMLMADGEAAIRLMQKLNTLGFSIAIDDFGTGYSSLSYLKRLPIDVLKIDQSFIRDLPHDNEDAAIVNTIVNMAQGLGLKTVAEGVESTAQLDYLSQLGCDQMQGYLFSPPMPADDVVHWLKAGAYQRDHSVGIELPPLRVTDKAAI